MAAYAEKYYLGWQSKDASGVIRIYEDGYGGASSKLILGKDSLQIKYQFNDWNNPVIKLNTSFDILNDKSDYWDLLPLLTNQEREFKVEIESLGQSLFSGFLDVANNEQPYLHNKPIRLTASPYLNKLKEGNLHSTSIDSIQKRSIISTINDNLKMTELDFPINVNMTLEPSGFTCGNNQTALNVCGINTETFWKNNIERDNGLTILEKLLTPFDCYLYWYNDEWYIERYEDIWNETKMYVKYADASTYWYEDFGKDASVTDTSTALNSLTFRDQSQALGIIPGLGKIEVKLNKGVEYLNVVNNIFDVTNTISGHVPYPSLKEWEFWSTSIAWYNRSNYKNIINTGVYRAGGASNIADGMYTRFSATIDSSVECSIKWKCIPLVGSTPSNYQYKFHYFLRHPPGNYYIVYIEEGDFWERKVTSAANGAQDITIIGSDFDSDTHFYPPSVTIPIGDVSGLTSGDKEFIFGLTRTTYRIDTDGDGWDDEILNYITSETIGDIEIQISADNQDNLLVGNLSTNFLNTKKIELDFYDVDNDNFSNGFYSDASYGERTSTWSTDITENAYNLADNLIYNKGDLFKESRQKISGIVRSPSSALKPFSLWYDSNQSNKQFILTDYIFKPQKNEYLCNWCEYEKTN